MGDGDEATVDPVPTETETSASPASRRWTYQPRLPATSGRAVAPTGRARHLRVGWIGVVLLGGLGCGAAAADVVMEADVPWRLAPGLVLVVLGGLLLVGARTGPHDVVGMPAVLLLVALWVPSVLGVDVSGPVGGRDYTATTVAELAPEYRVGVGTLRLDLADLRDAGPGGEVRVEVGVGQVLIEIGPETAIRVDGHGRLAQIDLDGSVATGWDVHRSARWGDADRSVLVVTAEVGVGQVKVRRVP